MPQKPREPHELQEIAWGLVEEALTKGTITLKENDGISIGLNSDVVIRLAQWLCQAKAKKPHLVNPPEDFILKETGDAEED